MSNFLSVSRAKWEDVKAIRTSLSGSEVLFDTISFDYMTITIYADFEKELNSLIMKKLSENEFSKKYATFVKLKYKQLHGGLKSDTFKDLIHDVFSDAIVIGDKDWITYCGFIKFRNSISHDDKYETAKNTLISNIKSFDDILDVLTKYLNALEKI